MNSTNNFSSSSKHASPARLSPAGRRAARLQSVSAAFGTEHFGGSGSAATEDLFSQIWAPGLLDRLQAPLTRYRE